MSLLRLAKTVGQHPNTLRGHLDALRARGLVRRQRAEPVGRGRPAWLYEPAGAAGGGGRGAVEYASLAAALAAGIERHTTAPHEEGVEVGLEWGRELATSLLGPASGGTDPQETVIDVLARLGFAPRARGSTVRLTQCPLLDTARQHPDVVCGVHLGLVRAVLEACGADGDRAELVPFAEAGACRLELGTGRAA